MSAVNYEQMNVKKYFLPFYTHDNLLRKAYRLLELVTVYSLICIDICQQSKKQDAGGQLFFLRFYYCCLLDVVMRSILWYTGSFKQIKVPKDSPALPT